MLVEFLPEISRVFKHPTYPPRSYDLDLRVYVCVSVVATKISSPAELDVVSESLGVAAVFIQDMKERRRVNYQFSWQRMLNLNGDTGVFLQYTHSRLHRCSLSMCLSVCLPFSLSLSLCLSTVYVSVCLVKLQHLVT